MKNCPFCGEEIQDTAKKCKHCKEWLKFKVCPVCGESIPANSTVCKFCNEDVEEPEKKIEKKEPKSIESDKESNDEKSVDEGINIEKKGAIKRIWDEYAVLIIIIFLIFGYSFYKNLNNPKTTPKTETDVTQEYTDNGGSLSLDYTENSESNNSTSKNTYEIVSLDNYSKKNDFDSRYILELNKTDGGLVLENDLYSCKIDDKNIQKFVDSINNNGVVEYCNPIWGNNLGGEVSIGIFVDNSYASDNLGKLDTTGPQNRIDLIEKILNKYSGNAITVYLGFLYATKENEELSEVINNRIIKLKTEGGLSGSEIKVYSDKKNPIEYIDKKHKIRYERMIFVLDYDKCNKSGKDYVCYNVESLNNKIREIYKNEFDKEELHKGNPMIEYFADQKIQGYFNKIENAYILTDGQFEVTDNYKSLKEEANRMSNFPEYKISNFYVESYAKNRIPFEKFWNNNAIKGGLGNINCEGLVINFIGLVGGNPGFTNFAHDYFANKIFTGCDVIFDEDL